MHLFDNLDQDQSGDISIVEFVDGIQHAQGSASPNAADDVPVPSLRADPHSMKDYLGDGCDEEYDTLTKLEKDMIPVTERRIGHIAKPNPLQEDAPRDEGESFVGGSPSRTSLRCRLSSWTSSAKEGWDDEQA